MRNLSGELQHFESLLSASYDPDEARSITRLVFEELFHLKAHELRLSGNRELDAATTDRLDEILKRLLKKEPVHYILGYAWFRGERYLVNPSTLIPRPETEELVQWVLENGNLRPGMRILDIGTGSGCIAISLQLAHQEIRVFGMDISPLAVDTSKKNALNLLGIEATHRFMQGNLSDSAWWDQHGNWDIILSNPPYIKESEKAEMETHVLDFEPETALFVPEEDPLVHYRNIAEEGLVHLSQGGQIFFEINQALGQDMLDMLENQGYEAELRKDMFGKDRMIRARKKV